MAKSLVSCFFLTHGVEFCAYGDRSVDKASTFLMFDYNN